MSLFAAIDAHGNTRYIGEVLRGAACGCFCGECKSPVVAKHGGDHVWHFAHEASQERPQCLPGSINLLRRLATERLLESDTLTMPECKKVVSADWRYSDIHEVATWTLPDGRISQRDMHAAVNKPVAQICPTGMPDCTIGLWVQIGELNPDINVEFDGELVYHCQAPTKGGITTLATAVAFLQMHSRWHWQKFPDVFGALGEAQKRLHVRVAAHKAEQVAKLQRLRELQQQRSAPIVGQRTPYFIRPPMSYEGVPMPSQAQEPATRPQWADLKKKNSSFFAFQMRNEGEFWIVMEAADHPGYYIVPGTGLWDGWDEALPLSIGLADLHKGVYRGDHPVNHAIQLMRNLGVSASRIDSDANIICAFTGWKASSL
jgi:hypothetical protein